MFAIAGGEQVVTTTLLISSPASIGCLLSQHLLLALWFFHGLRLYSLFPLLLIDISLRTHSMQRILSYDPFSPRWDRNFHYKSSYSNLWLTCTFVEMVEKGTAPMVPQRLLESTNPSDSWCELVATLGYIVSSHISSILCKKSNLWGKKFLLKTTEVETSFPLKLRSFHTIYMWSLQNHTSATFSQHIPCPTDEPLARKGR